MNIPGLGKIATFALKRIVLPAIGKAIVTPGNPLDRRKATDLLTDAIEAEAMRQAGKWGRV